MAGSSAIATAYVELVSDGSKFAGTVRTEVAEGLAGANAAAEAGTDRIVATVDKNMDKVGRSGKAAGQQLGDGLDDGAKKGEASFKKFAESAVFAKATQVIAGFAKDAIGAASDMAEATSKSEVIFGEGATAVQQYAEGAARSIGLSSLAALDASSTFAVFGKSAGLAGTDLTVFSTDLTTLAADMASFSNTSPEQAIEAIGAALRGESEPIRSYGVLLDDATLKARAMELGIYDGVGALTAQQRVLAAQKEILVQTGDAQGDFARTSDGLANSTKTLQADFENMKVKVGSSLVPAMQLLVAAAGDVIGLFTLLPAPVQALIVVALLAVTAFAAMSSAIQAIGVSAATANKALGAIGLALTAAIVVYGLFTSKKKEAIKATDDFIAALQAEEQGQRNATAAVIAKRIADDEAFDAADKLGFSQQDLARIISGESLPAFAALKTAMYDNTVAPRAQFVEMKKLADQYGLSREELLNFVAATEKARTEMQLSREESSQLTSANKAAEVAVADLSSRNDELIATSGRLQLSQEQVAALTDAHTKKVEENEQALKDQADKIKDVEDALRGLIDATLSSFSAELQLQDARFGTADALTKYDTLVRQVTDGTYEGENALRDLSDAQRDALQATLGQAAAAAQLASDTAEANGATLSAADAAIVQRDELQKVADALAPDSPLRSQLQDYIDTLNNKIPKDIVTNLSANVRVNVNGKGILGTMYAEGTIANRPTWGVFGEAGPEAVIPISKPARAMELLNKSGLGAMWDAQRGARDGPLVAMYDTVVQDATDVELIAQRTGAAVAVRSMGT